jgi:uncharacterized beta-barrel protein YwiB (DUF1934 family)
MTCVKIHIKGIQYIDEQHPLVTELFTEGFYHKELSCVFYEYEESESLGISGVITKLIVSNHHVITLERMGPSFSSSMTFDKNILHQGQYVTEFGTFDLKIDTSNINFEIGSDGKGEIFMDYRLSIGNQPEVRNTLEIKIT